MRSLKLFSLVACLFVMLPMVAHAQTTTNFVAGAGYAALSGAEATNAEAYTGTGSWYKNWTLGDPAVVELYIDPATQFGTTFTIDEIADIRYWTKNDGNNPSDVDFFMKIYTVPDGVDDDAGWYGRRLNAEPYFSNNYVDPTTTANTWVQWSAATPPQNQLTWFDFNNCGNYGFYGQPTLGDLQTGAVTWTDYPGAAASANPDPVDYGPETVLYFTLGTGSGWSSFEGYVDAVEFELTNGDVYVFDLEGLVDPVYVDDDWAGAPAASEVAPGMFLGYNAFDTVQGGVNAALTQVNVAGGLYPEQVVIDKDLEVLGAGMGVSTIVSPATLDIQFSTSYDYKPVVTAIGAANVEFRGFTVDGDGQGNANVRFLGVAYYNAGGELAECEVIGVRNNPLDGGQHGVGIYGLHTDGGSYTAVCRDNLVEDFQKNGMAWVSVGGSVVDLEVTGNTVNGSPGMTADNGDPAQNGIQVQGALTTALIDDNTVDGVGYDNTNAAQQWVATSILTYYGDVTVSNNLITNAQTAGYTIEGSAAYLTNTVEVVKYGNSAYGLIVADPPEAVPAPFEGPAEHTQAARRAGVINATVSGNTITFTGVDNLNSVGIESDAGYYDFLADGPETQVLLITDNTVTGFEAAVAVFECTSGCTGSDYTSVDIHNNDLAGNTYGLYTNAFSATVDASCNWWGDISGPTAIDNVLGTGALLEGAAVYEPWLDGPAGACVLSSDYVYAGPAPSEIAGCTSCVEIPVTLFRSDTSAARGVSVTFELSPELELCGTPAISLGAGTFYDGYAGQVQTAPLIDNGGGSWTFDTAIGGLPCGPTVGGEVFTIPVTYAASVTGDATGTVTITSVTLRDCNNAPLPAMPGAGTTVDIDLTAPGPVTNLVATQKLAGNGTTGTTFIDLTWDLPVDTDVTSLELYRKGFGHYPEYDDDGGSVPTAPTDPTDALANGWVLAETLVPGTTSTSTQTAARDFWYFVMFVNDECYSSVVSNQTDGTLGYHLGDVAGPGDNQVATIDVSKLGAAYGTIDGDLNYNQYVDVGPTTDYSVLSRPTTDNMIQFEDLIVFAINFGQVSRPVDLDVAAFNELELVTPQALAQGERVSVPIRMAGDGTLQGVSVKVGWNEDVLEYAGFSAGDLMVRNGAPVFSPKAGVIDTAVLGNTGQGISGEGLMASLQFKVRSAGDPGLVIQEVDARNGQNEKVTLDGRVIGDTPTNDSVVRRSALRPNVPNPFNPRTTVYFDVAVNGPVTVRVYSLSGRLVRTLVSGPMTVGNHEVVWNGIDDAGRTVASGTYLVQMVAMDRTDSRSMVLLK